MLTLKAYNGRCVMEWLAVRVYEAYLNPQYAAFDPTRFCVIAGAMSLGGTLIARSDLQPNCVCVRAKQEWDFVVGPRMGGSDSCSINSFCSIGHICTPLQTISRGSGDYPVTSLQFHTFMFSLVQSFSRKKKWIPGLPSLYAEEVCCEIHWIGGKVWSVLEAWRHQILLEQQKSINYLMKSQTVRMVDG